MSQTQVLQFQPLNSAVEAAFWHELGEAKIEKFKLDDKARPVVAYYAAGTHEEVPPRVCLGSNALTAPRFFPPFSSLLFLPSTFLFFFPLLKLTSFWPSDRIPPYNFPTPGLLKNTNTLEAFKDLDKTKEFADAASIVSLSLFFLSLLSSLL